jgi:hypothetical protein
MATLLVSNVPSLVPLKEIVGIMAVGSDAIESSSMVHGKARFEFSDPAMA